MLPQMLHVRRIQQLSLKFRKDVGGEHQCPDHVGAQQFHRVEALETSHRKPKKAELTSCRIFAVMAMSAEMSFATFASDGSGWSSSSVSWKYKVGRLGSESSFETRPLTSGVFQKIAKR